MKPLSLLIVAGAFGVMALGVEITMKFGFRGLAHAGAFAAAIMVLTAVVSAFLIDKKEK